jgi:serine/threonine protein phosphatase PrpC
MSQHPDPDKRRSDAEPSRGDRAEPATPEPAPASVAPASDGTRGSDAATGAAANAHSPTPGASEPETPTAAMPDTNAGHADRAAGAAPTVGSADGPEVSANEAPGSTPGGKGAAPDAKDAGALGDSPGPQEAKPAQASIEPATISARVYGRSDVGQVREHNEDNLLIADLTTRQRGESDQIFGFELGRGGGLLAVCDGMGGAAAGEIASQLAVDIVYERMVEAAEGRDRDRLAMAMVEALEYAGVRILAESNKNRACRGMGTTATVAAWVDDHLLLGQVGDSRGYLLRGERLVQITRDQSLVNQLIEAGQLTEEEAENFEHSNIILQALGTADAVQVDLTYTELRRGDGLLLCSDGLSGLVRDDEMREILLHNTDPAEACRLLVDEANEAGGHDNITAIVAVFDGDALRVASEEDVLALRYRKYPLPPWMDHRNVDTGGLVRFGSLDAPYDDTPYIEVHGEIELGPEADWDDLLEDSPQIPTASGPSWSTVAIVAVVVGVLLALYLMTR